MVRVALLSMAHVHAAGYAQQLLKHPDAEIACVWDDDPARGRPAAAKLGAPFEDDLHDVLGDDEIGAVAINSETHKHFDLISAALDAGKHVFTEKALTIDTRGADELVRMVEGSGLSFMISLPQRSQPEPLFMKQCLDEGWIGQVTLMRARIAHAAALDRWFKEGSLWFGDPRQAGGGSLFDLGCHTVDAMRWFLGEPESVSAMTTNLSGAYDIDDQCVALVRFRSGALGILDVSWVHRAGPNTWEIYGTEGFVGRGFPGQGIQLQSRRLEVNGLPGAFTPSRLPPPMPTPLEQWLAAIEKGEPMRITVRDGRNLTELLEGIYTAAREGREFRFGL